MNCRKCGGKAPKRKDGSHSCRHCGTQPGEDQFDRSGTDATPRAALIPTVIYGQPYIIGTIRPVLARAKNSTQPIEATP